MARRRSGNPEMNFDGLTDSVTNLVGALILIVIMLIGVTRDVLPESTPAIPQFTLRVEKESLEETKTVEELLRRVQYLQSEIDATDQRIKVAEAQVDELQVEAQALIDSARSGGS